MEHNHVVEPYIYYNCVYRLVVIVLRLHIYNAVKHLPVLKQHLVKELEDSNTAIALEDL